MFAAETMNPCNDSLRRFSGQTRHESVAARGQPSGPVSLGDVSFNLQPATAIGQAVAAIQQVAKQLGKPLSLQTSFQGNAQAFTASLSRTPILIAAALFDAAWVVLSASNARLKGAWTA